MRVVALLIALVVAGCIGGHGCGGGTLHGEWVEPGLHARVVAQDGATVFQHRPPPEPHVRNATLEEAWGTLGLMSLVHQPDGPRHNEAGISRDPRPTAPLHVYASVQQGRTTDDATHIVRELLEHLELPEDVRELYATRIRDAFVQSPPGVANSVASTPLEHDIAWESVPDMLFQGDVETHVFSDHRAVSAGSFRLTLKVGTWEVHDRVDGRAIRLDVSEDDRVRIFVDQKAGDSQEASLARVNAMLARQSLPPATFAGFEGAVAIC